MNPPQDVNKTLWGEDAEAVAAAVNALSGQHPERGGIELEQAAFAVVQAIKPLIIRSVFDQDRDDEPWVPAL
jgi:hypothetical protein